MGKRKNKCYAVPRGFLGICDGCRTNSTKCPYRDKTRDSRHIVKRQAQKEIRHIMQKGDET